MALAKCRVTYSGRPAVALALPGVVVAGPAVDRGYLQTHRPQIRRELSPMVDQIEMKEPKNLAEGSLQKNLFASVQLRRFLPPFLIHVSKLVGQRRGQLFELRIRTSNDGAEPDDVSASNLAARAFRTISPFTMVQRRSRADGERSCRL
jgi:hypothetical protein